MNLLFYVAALLLGTGTEASSPPHVKRQATPKYCSPEKPGMCFAEVETRPGNPTYRIAIPDTAVPFDTLLQIISPASLGWAGFAWGGGMTLNPLVVAWPNGDKGFVASSRWATSV